MRKTTTTITTQTMRCTWKPIQVTKAPENTFTQILEAIRLAC